MKALSLSIAIALTGVAVTGRAMALPAMTEIAVPLSPRVAARDLGHAPAIYPVSIVVTLPYRHAQQLERLIEAQGDPDSPAYHHFLTPAQFASIYGPAPQDEMAVVQLLRREGFTITQRFSNRTVVDAAAPAAIAERYFHTEIHLALQADGVHYFNARPAIVPPALASRAFAVIGLSNLRTVPARAPQAPSEMRVDRKGLGGLLENAGGFGPLGFAQGYDLPIQHGYTGKGIKVAEIENAEPIPGGYIPEFSWAFHFPLPTGSTGASTKLVRVDGGCQSSVTCNGPSTVNFDYHDYLEYQEYLAALAPGIDAYLYQIPDDTTTSWTDAFNKVVSDNQADVVALGAIFHWESDTNSESFALALDQIIQQGNALGMTLISPGVVVFETGPVAAIPSDSPHVLVVGGSNIQVTASGAFHSDAALVESNYAGPAVSLFFPEPPYKSGIPGTSKSGRDIPDLVAAQYIERSTASTIPLSQYEGQFKIYEGGSWGDDWTNRPSVVALVADIDQMNGSRSGLINSTIFRIYKKNGYGPAAAPLFHDITKVTPDGPPPLSIYLPSKGYDWVSGIGSIDGWNFAQAMRKKK